MSRERRGYDPSQEKGKINFFKGQEVRVKRSNGTIELDWEVAGINPKAGTIKVAKIEKNRGYSKNIPVAELLEINPEVGKLNGFKEEKEKKLVLKEGREISVERSDGSIEDGWKVDRVSETGKIVVRREDGDRFLEKRLTVEELRRHNPDIG